MKLESGNSGVLRRCEGFTATTIYGERQVDYLRYDVLIILLQDRSETLMHLVLKCLRSVTLMTRLETPTDFKIMLPRGFMTSTSPSCA